MFDTNGDFKVDFLDLSFKPQLSFIRSKAKFKLRFKDCFGFHIVYFDFLPIKSSLPSLQELLILYRLTNTTLERCPKSNHRVVTLSLKSKPKRQNGSVKKKSNYLSLF